MSRPLRVFFATPHTYLPQNTGGMEVNTEALCRALLASGFHASVYCGFDDAKAIDRGRRALHKLFARTLLSDDHRGYRVHRAKYPIDSAAEAIAVAKPDVVVVQGWDAHELARPFVRAGLPTLIYLHNAQRFAFDDELRRSPHLFFAVNSRFTASLHPDKTVARVFPPLIETAAYRVESTREAVLFVNPIPKKGVDIALDLARARPDVPFDVYEAWTLTPSERQEGRRLFAALPNVRWRPAVDDMRKAYVRAKLVLFPSAMETWGRVASEGHVSGIPTLGSDRGALPETIGPAGLCLPLEAPHQDWLAAFGRLWDDAGLYRCYSDAARAFSERDEIRADRIVGSFIDLLRQMAG